MPREPIGEAVGRELDAVHEIAKALEPLSPGARARVLLHVILAKSPHAVSNAQLWGLVVLGKEP